MENQIEEIKKKIDIIEFIGSFITLKKVGRNFKANCPFHQEKTPSFVVSPERQIWHCFGGCGDGGDIIKFLMKWENITFIEALKELAQKAGVPLKNVDYEDRIWKKKERYFMMNAQTSEFFEYLLNKTKFGKKGLEYLKNRDIKVPIIKKFQLGYSPSSWDSLRLFLKKKNYSDEEISENGLLVKNSRNQYYDRFRGRLMFPLKDARGNIVGFSGRILETESKEAKYINTPETPIYHKRETLFGIDLARDTIKKEKNVFIVEGEFDMITPYAYNFSNFVAIKGAAITTEQLMLLKRYTDKITLFLDTDEAGEEAMKRGIVEAEKMDFDIQVIKINFAKDPDEAVRKNLNAFKKAVEKPIPIYDFIIESAVKKYSDDTPFNKKKIGDEVIPYVERIVNPIVKSYYVKKIAKLLNVEEEGVTNLISKIKRKIEQKTNYKLNVIPRNKEERQLIIEKYLLSLVFQSEDVDKMSTLIFSVIKSEDFSLPVYKKICSNFLDKKETGKKFDVNSFVNHLPAEVRPVFDEIYLFDSSEHNLSKENIEKLMFELKRFSLKNQIKKILEEKSENKENNSQLVTITNSLKEVEKKLLSL
jgi:DNA primase